MIDNSKVRVKVLQERNVDHNTVIETEIDFKGIKQRRRFVVPDRFVHVEKVKHISDILRQEARQNVVNREFEVDL